MKKTSLTCLKQSSSPLGVIFVKEIKTLEAFASVTEGGTKCIVMFTANWCPDCVFVKPFLPELVEAFSEFEFYTVNRDELLDLCVDLEIMGIPSFVAYDGGKEVGRFVSKDRKARAEIEAFIKEL